MRPAASMKESMEHRKRDESTSYLTFSKAEKLLHQRKSSQMGFKTKWTFLLAGSNSPQQWSDENEPEVAAAKVLYVQPPLYLFVDFKV